MRVTDVRGSRGVDRTLAKHPGERVTGRRTGSLRTTGILAAALLILGVACSESPTAPPRPEPDPGVTELPSRFRVEGSAVGTEQARSVECRIDVVFELGARSEADAPFDWVYQGTHFGEVERVIDTGEGGFAFHAAVGGEVIVRLARSGMVEIEIPANHGAESRFWRNLALMEGMVGDDGDGTGTWQCAPLDIESGGFDDRTVTVEVLWTWTSLE